ncbi:hypothetical protein Ciccas_006739 [Cichlidogyrus casuarinus]|uniref:Uncharacterized protein n=1 Tax=Cichlidogyrus casuarinus TaxID=1844966 RepID=A0ABD2Q4Y2_9PLAT
MKDWLSYQDKKFVALFTIICAVNCLHTDDLEWEKFKLEHGRMNKNQAKEEVCQKLRLHNKEMVEQHNRLCFLFINP